MQEEETAKAEFMRSIISAEDTGNKLIPLIVSNDNFYSYRK